MDRVAATLLECGVRPPRARATENFATTYTETKGQIGRDARSGQARPCPGCALSGAIPTRPNTTQPMKPNEC